MSNINQLVSRIIDDAEVKAKELLDAAEKEKAKKIESSREVARLKAADLLNKAEKDAAEKNARMISSAQLEVRNKKLEAKQSVIDSVFESAVETLLALPEDQYLNMFTEQIAALPIEGNEQLIIAERDKERMNEQFLRDVNQLLNDRGKLGQLSIRSEFGNMKGGIIIAKNGIEINITIEALVFTLREELQNAIAALLFEE